MISQAFLPVVTEDQRILGWVVLDSPTTFVGNETTKVVASKTLAIQKYTMNRKRDFKPIEFMGINITLAAERLASWNTFPNFAEVGANTPLKPWIQTGSHVYSPHSSGAISDMEKFLNSF